MNTKTKAPAVAPVGSLKKQHSSLDLTDTSTGTGAQLRRTVQALSSGPKTTDGLRKLGCYQVSARLFGLRHQCGLNIITDLFDGYAADGYSHVRMGRYTLFDRAEEVAK